MSIEFIGPKLQVFCFDTSWGGRSNHRDSVNTIKEPLIKDISDAFCWIGKWKSLKGYRYGFIIDYEERVIYYDHIDALHYAFTHARLFGGEGLTGILKEF